MVLLCPRIHFYEIADQSWFPPYFRTKVQTCLALLWTFRLPILQPHSPATLVATTLQKALDPALPTYTYVDFCAGAGGPTPYIEAELNARLRQGIRTEYARQKPLTAGLTTVNGTGKESGRKANFGTDGKDAPAEREKHGVDFVLTDLHPHLEAWAAAAKKSAHLHYVSTSVDATAAPRDLGFLPPSSRADHDTDDRRIFRLFSLAFHHFDDPLATQILANTLAASDGFGIFELQARTLSSLLTVTLIWPLLWLITPFYFWRSPGHLFFTYVVPIIPFVLVFDGYVSSLRTRSAEEILQLVGKARTDHAKGWRFGSGSECHTWPTGEMTWFIGVKES